MIMPRYSVRLAEIEAGLQDSLTALKTLRSDLECSPEDKVRGQHVDRLLELLEASGKRPMWVEEIQGRLGCTANTCYTILSRLCKDGKVTRITRGCYIHTSVGQDVIDKLREHL